MALPDSARCRRWTRLCRGRRQCRAVIAHPADDGAGRARDAADLRLRGAAPRVRAGHRTVSAAAGDDGPRSGARLGAACDARRRRGRGHGRRRDTRQRQHRLPDPRQQYQEQPGLPLLPRPDAGRGMTLQALHLDDLGWRAMVDAIRGRIAGVSEEEWTLHAPVDPGVTLLELFAYLLEQRIYWLDQVPDALINGLIALLGAQRQPAVAATTL